MKKHMKFYMGGIFFIVGLIPLAASAKPYPGDSCAGSASFKEAYYCNVRLLGEDSRQSYTYAITYKNVGYSLGSLFSEQNVFAPNQRTADEFHYPILGSKQTHTRIIDSHYCSPYGQVTPNRLMLAGTSMGWNADFIEMEITEVTVLKSIPLSEMRCG